MRILRWLRRIVADYLGVHDESAQLRDDLERELDALRATAAVAVAQVGHTELQLREALEAEDQTTSLAPLVSRLTEERARAGKLIERYHRRQAQATEDLQRRGETRRIEQLNAERERLRRFVTDTSDAADSEALVELEDEARAEAARLDVLAAFDAGKTPATPAKSVTDQEEIREQARKLVEQDTAEQLWPKS